MYCDAKCMNVECYVFESIAWFQVFEARFLNRGSIIARIGSHFWTLKMANEINGIANDYERKRGKKCGTNKKIERVTCFRLSHFVFALLSPCLVCVLWTTQTYLQRIHWLPKFWANQFLFLSTHSQNKDDDDKDEKNGTARNETHKIRQSTVPHVVRISQVWWIFGHIFLVPA